MTVNYQELPPDWRNDELSEFIGMAFQNILTSFDRKKQEYAMLRDIDNAFKDIVRALNNPPGIVEAFLLMRSHSSYRASCTLALAGLAPETFVQVRSCLENALYALHISKNNGYDELWLNRHTNADKTREVKNKFQMVKVFDTLKSADSKNYDVAKKLYERTIDFGAHPNERASTSSMDIEDIQGGKKYKQKSLAGGTLQQTHAIKSTAQVGLCGLYIFREVFKQRFDILGITDRLDAFRKLL